MTRPAGGCAPACMPWSIPQVRLAGFGWSGVPGRAGRRREEGASGWREGGPMGGRWNAGPALVLDPNRQTQPGQPCIGLLDFRQQFCSEFDLRSLIGGFWGLPRLMGKYTLNSRQPPPASHMARYSTVPVPAQCRIGPPALDMTWDTHHIFFL